jgi:hypothetical protein
MDIYLRLQMRPRLQYTPRRVYEPLLRTCVRFRHMDSQIERVDLKPTLDDLTSRRTMISCTEQGVRSPTKNLCIQTVDLVLCPFKAIVALTEIFVDVGRTMALRVQADFTKCHISTCSKLLPSSLEPLLLHAEHLILT